MYVWVQCACIWPVAAVNWKKTHNICRQFVFSGNKSKEKEKVGTTVTSITKKDLNGSSNFPFHFHSPNIKVDATMKSGAHIGLTVIIIGMNYVENLSGKREFVSFEIHNLILCSQFALRTQTQSLRVVQSWRNFFLLFSFCICGASGTERTNEAIRFK